MTRLAVNYSKALVELIQASQAPIDIIEVGSWFSVKQIRAYQKQLRAWPFHFHGGGLINRVGLLPGAIRKIQAYHHCTRSRWASMHMSILLPGMVWLGLKRGWRLPTPNPARATRRLIRQVKRLQHALDVPIILENMPSLPFNGYEFEAQPERIAKILELTGCDLLLDIGHARVAAAALNLDVLEYLHRLPLDRVVQIHISGPRERNGRLADAHEPLGETDYRVLNWVLGQTRPQIVTLEYFRERDALQKQLIRLRKLIGAQAN